MTLSRAELAADLSTLTRDLVDIESVSGNEENVLDFIKNALPNGLDIHYDVNSVLFATTPRRPNTPLIVFVGHTDTVPINGNFPSRTVDDVIYGCGTSDMKGALAVMIKTANAIVLKKSGGIHSHIDVENQADIGFLFFGSEELPREHNVLLPALEDCEALRAADFAILMEPTSNAVEAGCQGNLNLTITYEGVSAHTARPSQGLNAAHMAIVDLHEVATATPNEVDIDGLIFSEVSNITSVRGGIARNVLPDNIQVDLNIRYAPTRTAEDMEEACRLRFERENVKVDVIGNAPPAPVVLNNKWTQRLLKAGAKAPVAKLAWTNAADFALHDIPAINFGPGNPLLAHKKDEAITVSSLVDSYLILQEFLNEKDSEN